MVAIWSANDAISHPQMFKLHPDTDHGTVPQSKQLFHASTTGTQFSEFHGKQLSNSACDLHTTE